MMKKPPDHSDSLVFECDFDEPPEKVWRALTEPRLLHKWLTADDAGQGHLGTEQAVPAPAPGSVEGPDRADRSRGTAGSSDCQIMTAEPNRLLRYRWRDREAGLGDSGDREIHSVVTIELAPCPMGGTHLRLTHGEFRIVSLAPSMYPAGVAPITSARRRRSPILSFAARTSWRRAA